MQLNKFTDYALRILIYIAPSGNTPHTIPELAQNLSVSRNHLMKIVHFMAKENWLITARGKGGGVRINPEVLKASLGQMIRTLQRGNPIVECNSPPCVLREECRLRGILDKALEQFYLELDQYTIEQVLEKSFTRKANNIIDLINLN